MQVVPFEMKRKQTTLFGCNFIIGTNAGNYFNTTYSNYFHSLRLIILHLNIQLWQYWNFLKHYVVRCVSRARLGVSFNISYKHLVVVNKLDCKNFASLNYCNYVAVNH